MAKAELQYFNTNGVGMNDTERDVLSRQTFAPLQAAFDAITDEATKGNQAALQALALPIVQWFLQHHHAVHREFDVGRISALQVQPGTTWKKRSAENSLCRQGLGSLQPRRILRAR